MNETNTISFDLGDELNQEFLQHWNELSKADKSLEALSFSPHVTNRTKGSLSFAIPDSVLITIATTAGTTIVAEIVKTFWKELVDFVKKKHAERKNLKAITVTVAGNTQTIPTEKIETVIDNGKFNPQK